MTTRIAIIGDRFMLPEIFQREIEALNGTELDIRCMANDWPDEPVEHGYINGGGNKPANGLEGLKEYIGEPDAICDFIGDADILVTHLAPLSDAMLQRLPNLKLVAVSRGGPVNIDTNATRKRNITVVNAPGRNASAVAEFTIGAILAETRLIRIGHETLRQGEWRGDLYRADRTGRELKEMTVGLVGYGQIGTRLTSMLMAFGPRILVTDPYVNLSEEHQAAGVEQVSFDTLLEESDIVSLHARVTDETKHMINAKTLAKMREGSLFINTARGPLVDYPALTEALKQGRPAAAMLETFDIEPPPADKELLSLPNVTLTPHIAGASVYTITKAAAMIAEEIRHFLNNEPPLNTC
jgi:D-3-phosphoglycerate dehydrogenase